MNNDKYNFDDITPLPVSDEAPETKDVVLCKIMYTVEFETVFWYLRALMAKTNFSERAMYVACCAISIVPAHYTVFGSTSTGLWRSLSTKMQVRRG